MLTSDSRRLERADKPPARRRAEMLNTTNAGYAAYIKGNPATTRRKSWRGFRARGSSGWAPRLEWAQVAPRWSPAEEAQVAPAVVQAVESPAAGTPVTATTAGGKEGAGGPKKSPAGKAKMGGTAIASESQVAPGSAYKFEDSGNPALLVHLENGDFVAYSAVCTHQGCKVAYQDGNLACPCHGSIFDPANGASVVSGPAQRPLPEIPVKVEGGEVVRA